MEKIDSTRGTFWDFKGKDEYIDKKFLMASPFPIVSIAIIYLWFVLKMGPDLMKKRPPFNLKNWLIAYNGMQVALSCYMFIYGFQFLIQKGVWHTACYIEIEEYKNMILDGSHLYFIAKVIELLDTVFFVLRKKQNQVSFLHVYHHTIMVIATWSVVKYNKSDNTMFLGTINSFVHIIMYSYYGLSVFPKMARFLRWKRYITIIQLVQFTLMFLHIVVANVISECRPAPILLASVCFNTILFMYLFGEFYIKSYIKNYKTRDLNNENIGPKIVAKNGINYIINQHKLASKVQ